MMDYLEEYAGFLENAIQAQNDKLEALLSHDVTIIESSVAAQQNLAIQMEQFEKGREKHQQEAGFADKTLTEIARELEQARRILNCQGRMSKAVEQIKFLNSKAMRLVETNLQIVNMGAPPLDNLETYTERAKKIASSSGQSIFQAKV